MKYRAEVKNGVVLLDKPNGLANGTVVEVEPVPEPTDAFPRRGSAEAILRYTGIWENQSDEDDRMLEELRRAKQAELDAQARAAPATESLD